MQKYANNVKSITLDIKDIELIVQRYKQLKQGRVTFVIDYNTKTVTVSDKNIMMTIKGF